MRRLIVLTSLLFGCSPPPATPPATTPATNPALPAFQPGDVVWLAEPGSTDQVPAAADYFAWLAMLKAARAKDTVGAHDLINRGQLILVPTRTSARVLGVQPEYAEVRLIDGPFPGRAVYVPIHVIHRPWF